MDGGWIHQGSLINEKLGQKMPIVRELFAVYKESTFFSFRRSLMLSVCYILTIGWYKSCFRVIIILTNEAAWV